MKKALLMMGLGTISFLWGSQDMTIQVISAVHEKSITHDFDEKLKNSGMAITKKVENGRYIVTLGSYKDLESAKKDLEKVRSVVMKDAFVRPVERSAMAVAKSVKAKPKIVASHSVKKVHAVKKEDSAEKTKVAVKTKGSEPSNPSPSVKHDTVAASSEVHEVEKKPAVEVSSTAVNESTKHPAAVVEGATPAPSEVKSTPILASVVLLDRNELRRQEIHEAIEYYKNSPYHRFEVVKMKP